MDSDGMDSAARSMRALAGIGALACGAAVGIGAYAMHGASTPQDHERLAIAAVFLFAHGLALASLAPGTRSRLRQAGFLALMIGTILFAGSLVLAALLGIAPTLAPFGGSLLMLGWLLIGGEFLFG
jgi:uncharacterized membrane protein YgdD (TMEM256/DUF423 family)